MLTVCICTHNRPTYVRDCIAGLRQQTAEPGLFEILVVDSASTGDVRARLGVLVAEVGNARLVTVAQVGVSIARNAGAAAAAGDYVAYIDDDAIPEPDWVACILTAIDQATPPPAMLGGRILPYWEAPLPAWWPPRLRGLLSIIEAEGQGEYRTAALPPGLEPYGANMVVQVRSLFSVGGFGITSGRSGEALMSDEEVQVAWKLQAAGFSVRYDSRIAVRHQIQSSRLTPGWLMSRVYWQGVSTVLTRRLLGHAESVWRELPRRISVALLLAPVGLVPRRSTWLINCRWRLAYALGFIRGALGWHTNPASTPSGK